VDFIGEAFESIIYAQPILITISNQISPEKMGFLLPPLAENVFCVIYSGKEVSGDEISFLLFALHQ
jgi:hypothetical protein